MAETADEIMEEEKDSGEETFRYPLGVTADEDGPDGFVRVNVVFPGLKKKFLKNAPSNGNVDLKMEERSLNLMLTMTTRDKKKLEKFQYLVKKLPDSILPEKSYYKVRENQIVVFLKKVDPRSWARELSETGLETFEEQDEVEINAEDIVETKEVDEKEHMEP